MAVIKKWDGIGVANGPLTVSTAGSGGDTVFNAVALTPTVTSGTIQIPNIAGITYFRWNNLSLSTWSTRFYMRLEGTVSAETPFLYAWRTNDARMWVLALLPTRQVVLRNTLDVVVKSGPILTLGVTYRFEARGQAGIDLITFKIFDASETEIYATTTAIGTTLGLHHLQFGRQSTVQFGPAYYSHLQVNNTNATIGAYVAPAVSAPWVVLNSNGTTTPLTLNGMWNGTSILPLDIGQVTPISPPPPSGTRLAYDWPFKADAMSNTSIGSEATYESAGDTRTARFLNATTVGKTINHTSWSIQVVLATNSDPWCTLKKPDGTVYSSGIRVPAALGTTSMPFPGGTDKTVVVVQPDGATAWDCYRMTKVNANSWTSTNAKSNNWKTSDGLAQGIRAAGISAGVGLIRGSEILAGNIPHVLAMSLPKEMLKQTPDASDGEVRSSGGKAVAVWPARLQDNQLNVPYNSVANGGVIAMGTLFAIPSSTAMPSGLSAEGQTLFHALQDYGVIVTDQSTTITLYVEQDLLNGDTADSAVIRMKNDWNGASAAPIALYTLLRRVTNNTSTNIAGGGTRSQPPPPAFA